VADFGLTRFISEKKQMTQVGTPMWMAPEIIMGKKYTEKADVYAFGIILWEILTRLEPYEEKEPMQIVVEVVNDGLRPTMPADCAESPLVPLMKGQSRANQHIDWPRLDSSVAYLLSIAFFLPRRLLAHESGTASVVREDRGEVAGDPGGDQAGR
jgi:serine/threonine protein kinase